VVANYFKDYQKLNNSLNKSLNTLNEKFNKKNAEDVQRDLGKIAKAKSKLIEKIINKGSNNSLRCLEIAMGASLTDEEKGATKRSEINSECYDIANPSYSDNGN